MSEISFFNPSSNANISSSFRLKRFALFLQLVSTLKQNKSIRILDIGGTQSFWEKMNFLELEDIEITLLNQHLEPIRHKGFVSVVGDACNMDQFGDNEFDIVFSNSVIEHLYTKENQRRMAAEVRRVGKVYFIQTPNYYFPIEPHWLFPFFQFLPLGLKIFVTRNYPVGRFARNKDVAEEMVREVRLLRKKEMLELFPDACLYKERFAGLTKSLIMYTPV